MADQTEFKEKSNWWGDVVCLLVSLIFAFVLIELVLRITNFNDLATYSVPCVRATSIPGLSAELTPNCTQKGTEAYNSGVIMHINSCGFRGSEEECDLLKSSQPSTTYVYVIGDSYTNAGNVNESDSFVKIAQQKLRETYPAAVVFNFAVAAASIDQKITSARYFLNKYPANKPAAIVFQWLLNDYDLSLDFSAGKSTMTKFKMFLREYFCTYRFVVYVKYLISHKVANSPVTAADVLAFRKYEFSSEEAFTKLKDRICPFAAQLREENIKPVFLNPPLQEMLSDWKDYDADMEKIDKRINEIVAQCGWTVVWPTPELKKYPISDIVVQPTGDHHPNVLGNKIIGEELGKQLEALLTITTLSL